MEKKTEMTLWPPDSSKQAEFARRLERTAPLPPRLIDGVFPSQTLNSVLNLDLVREKSADEITQVGSRRGTALTFFSFFLQGETFDVIWTRAQSCPAFLYALPRAEGYEFYVGQWSGTELHFTSLINIQSLGDAAPSQLIVYHYTDLQKEKGMVLMNSELDSTFLSVPEAQCLANQVQLFYSGDWFHLVESFNHTPNAFKYMSVVSALEQSGLGRAAH
ncbi:unnamed protein product [Staurois parvus]|uniref:ATP synthase mitochondrial F1 complex assembly factor 1 n=1 Tax=Staurois parvus TaxID=386267 RepID=A0ABN9GN87_9NEOB|nr:unnamed protein product [Staurois parvus]